MAPAPPERWEGLEVLARGANRLCARDPVDPAHCLKFELPGPERTRPSLRARLRRWYGRRFPSRADNGVELRACERLLRRHGASHREQLAAHFATCHGLVETRWGPALRCDCIRLPDGSPAPSLHRLLFGEPLPCRSGVSRDYAADGSRLTPLLQALDEFEAFLLARGIPLFDLNAGNLVVVPTDDGRVRLVCVDAKSTVSGKELLPLSRWVPWLRRRKVRRRAERLRRRIRDLVASAV